MRNSCTLAAAFLPSMLPLTLLAYALVLVFMALIMTRRLSVLTALILVPIVFGLLAGHGAKLGPMMLDGVRAIAPTGVMLAFAILYFGLMIDAGLFEPVVRFVLRVVGGDPVRAVVGTAVLALVVSLDGDGSTTYLIVTAAMLPLYRRLGLSPLVLASVIMQAGGVMNLLPWGGPTARAAAALKLDMGDLFVPLIGPMLAGAAWVVFVAWRLGRNERDRLAAAGKPTGAAVAAAAESAPPPRRFAFNLVLTLGLLTALIAGLMPLPVLFMIASALALAVNYPNLAEQRERFAAHAGNALAVAGVIFAAGVFTGILSGTKMIDAMAQSVVALVPPGAGSWLAVITAVLSVPFTFFISNDAFYYGVVPILAEAAGHYGISAVEIGRASLLGQPVHLLSPLVPSTYLLVGLCGVELGDHQKYTLRWSLGSTFVMLLASLLLGVIPLAGGR
jgi:CitMHS family citrate-Mg2+:H+ or citrate-Ca2+:H+ symporter